MAYRPKKEVLDSIKRYETTKNDGRKYEIYVAFLGTDPITKQKRRVAKSSREELETYITEFYRKLNKGGDSAVLLTPYQCLDARQAYELLAAEKIEITLTDVVKRYISGESADKKDEVKTDVVTLGDAFRAYIETIPVGHHRRTIKSRIGIWVTDFGGDRPITEVTTNNMSQFLKDHCKAPKTYNNYRSYIKTFFTWCMNKERRWLAENPCEDIRMQTIAYHEPEYGTVDDVRTLFQALWKARGSRPELLAYAILSFFTGTRREEILRMAEMDDAARISIEDETIRISKPKGYTKGISPRAFTIMPNALMWMKSFDFEKSIKFIREKTTKDLRTFEKDINVNIPKNAGRHSFITYHVAAFGDPSKTEAMVGTSKKMRVSNYCGLAPKKDGAAYFAILPPNHSTGESA